MTSSLTVNVEFSQTLSLPNGGSVEVAINQVVVEVGRILGTGLVILDVWEVSDRSGFIGSHSTISANRDPQGRWMGAVSTRRLPAEIDSIPFGENRIAAVRAFHQALDQAAALAIATVVLPWHQPHLVITGAEGHLQFETQDQAEAWLAKV